MRYWLSFVDTRHPDGDQFLGASIVRADDDISAVKAAHAAGCNPGGEVAIMAIDETCAVRLSFPLPEWRLLPPDEARELADRVAKEIAS